MLLVPSVWVRRVGAQLRFPLSTLTDSSGEGKEARVHVRWATKTEQVYVARLVATLWAPAARIIEEGTSAFFGATGQTFAGKVW